MNEVVLMGRLTRDPDIRWTQGQDQKCIARYTLAVDRRVQRTGDENQITADFISCVCFGKAAEFCEKYVKKGTKLVVHGRIQTGSYVDRNTNQKVYTTDVVVEDQEFAESKRSDAAAQGGYVDPTQMTGYTQSPDGFMNLPDGMDEELPFN